MTDLTKNNNNNNNDDANITIELDTLLDEVRLCIEKCRQFNKIPGIGKLERKFRAEDRFLQRVCKILQSFIWSIIKDKNGRRNSLKQCSHTFMISVANIIMIT
jgi:hypothetical protein